MTVKAISLFSGGLDSLLAYHMVKRQGIDVEAVWFDNCYLAGHVNMVKAGQDYAWYAQQLKKRYDVEVTVLSVCDEFNELMLDPPHGFGKHVNPCIDCKIVMLKRAKSYMLETGAKFLITGEVLGQRPMSQNRNALDCIQKNAGVNELLLRPLSARNLEPSLAEIEGWVNREELGSITGRGRHDQMALAAEYGITDIPQPAGGCLLTDPAFGVRLKDYMDHGGVLEDRVAPLLVTGRYFRINEKTVLIGGRNAPENEALDRMQKGYVHIAPDDVPGPTGLILVPEADQDIIRKCCSILSRYISKIDKDIPWLINGQEKIMVDRMSEEEVKKLILV